MNSILLRLTRLHIRMFTGGRFVRTQTMKTQNGKEQEVAVFSSEKPTPLGECTPFKTIVIHESALNSERLSDYVLIHEMAHRSQWWSLFKIPLGLLVLFGPICELWVVALVLTPLTLSVFSWILELNADFIVIRQLGLDTFVEIRGELRKICRPTTSAIVISFLTHPPLGVTVGIWRRLHEQVKP